MHKTTISYSIILFSIVFHMQAAETSTALSHAPYNDFEFLDSRNFNIHTLNINNTDYYEQTWKELVNLLPNDLHTRYPIPSFIDNNNCWDPYQIEETNYTLYLLDPYTDTILSNIKKLDEKKTILERFLQLEPVINQNKDNLSMKKIPDISYKQHLDTPIKYSIPILANFLMQQVSNTLNQYNPSAKEEVTYQIIPVSAPSQAITPVIVSQNNSSLTQEQHSCINQFFSNCKEKLNTIKQSTCDLNKHITILSDDKNTPHYPTIWKELEKLSKEMGSSHINYQATIEALTKKYAIFIAQKESADSADNAQRERELLQSTIMMYPHMDNIPSRNRINISNTLTPRDKCITIQNVIDDRMLMVNRILNK